MAYLIHMHAYLIHMHASLVSCDQMPAWKHSLYDTVSHDGILLMIQGYAATDNHAWRRLHAACMDALHRTTMPCMQYVVFVGKLHYIVTAAVPSGSYTLVSAASASILAIQVLPSRTYCLLMASGIGSCCR